MIFLAAVFAVTGLLLDKLSTAAWIKAAMCSARPPTVYHLTLNAILPRIRRAVDIAEPDGHVGTLSLLRSSFTNRLLDRAMLLAVVYPLFLLLMHWGLTKRPGTLGGTEILPAVDAGWKGYVTLCGIALVWASKFVASAAAVSTKRFIRGISDWLPVGIFLLFAGTLALIDLHPVAVAVALVVALAFGGAFAIAGAGAFASAFAIAVAVAFAMAVAGAFAGAGNVIAELLVKRQRGASAALVLLGTPTILVLSALWFVDWPQIGGRLPVTTAIFLFVGVLPLINAVFDTVSYGVTLALTERGRRGGVLIWAGVDFLVALVLFLLLGASLVLVVTGMQVLAGVPFADLPTLLTHKIDLERYWWLYAMLFSTAVPTLLHLFVASWSLQAVLPMSWRHRMCDVIDRAHEGAALDGCVATFVVGAFFAAGLILPILSIYVVGLVFWSHVIGPFLLGYQAMLVDLFLFSGG